MRRKAECGRRRRPPQRCGPRPSPQVTGRAIRSGPDPPLFSPQVGPRMAKPCFSAPEALRARPSEAHLIFGGGGGTRGPGELGPGVGGLCRVCSNPGWSLRATLARRSAFLVAWGRGRVWSGARQLRRRIWSSSKVGRVAAAQWERCCPLHGDSRGGRVNNEDEQPTLV